MKVADGARRETGGGDEWRCLVCSHGSLCGGGEACRCLQRESEVRVLVRGVREGGIHLL